MFLNYLKEFITKRLVKKKLSNIPFVKSDNKIKTIGIILDETYFNEREALIKDLVERGIEVDNIEILVFKKKISKKEVCNFPVFTNKDLKWNVSLEKKELSVFIEKPFDLLINYFDVEKTALLWVSYNSKAKFKVGFSSIDKRLNHFSINTTAENHLIFINELFKYLKILNKI